MPHQTKSPPSQNRVRVADLLIACVSGLSLAIAAVFLCSMPLASKMSGARDFVAYWATGHQLVLHADPYDGEAIMRMQHAAGLKEGVLYMRNPPWALPLAYPLGFTGIRVGTVIWTLLLTGCLWTSVHLVRTISGRPPNQWHWLGLSFPPALICLIMGQTSLLPLLGLTLFLRLHKNRPFLAGLSLWLCTIKPHLFLPFGTVLLAWIVVRRVYQVLIGWVVAMGISCGAVSIMAPSAWLRYVKLMRAPEFDMHFVPCLSDALRVWLQPHAVWLQYMPSALCAVWSFHYFWRHHEDWDWTKHGNPLILVSLASAPYCWIYDQCLAIPALLFKAFNVRSQRALAFLALVCLAVEFQLAFCKISSASYLWTPTAWLAFYLVAQNSSAPVQVDSGLTPEVAV